VFLSSMKVFPPQPISSGSIPKAISSAFKRKKNLLNLFQQAKTPPGRKKPEVLEARV